MIINGIINDIINRDLFRDESGGESMDDTKRQFLDILSAGIRNKNAEKLYDNVNWDEVLELANKHKVEGIIYSSLRRSKIASSIGEERLNTLRKKTILIGIRQSKIYQGYLLY